MIGVVVTFRYGDDFNEQAVCKIAETARTKFAGMPGLRFKAFTVNARERRATNFYVWETENAARAFFTDALLERVTGLYGVRPSVEFVQIAALVEGRPGNEPLENQETAGHGSPHVQSVGGQRST
jgi:hypothetical protein